jgi:membrane fusion protein (multidrug efflux system)
LLPPENATGNWVKVVQRVPIRLHLTHLDDALLLQAGLSADVTVDTRAPAEDLDASNRTASADRAVR